ncbi:hypothetical protein GJAV_G00016540 [Gymnothorax javanicus]|nr:hypothetical protein GJAV_G00016540 [Gymnothorax javanicus]
MLHSVDVEKGGSSCLPCKCVVSVIPNTAAMEKPGGCETADPPVRTSLSPDSALRPVSPQPSVLASLLAQRKSAITVPASSNPSPCSRGSSSRGSSVLTTPSTSPTVERLPYLPHSPFHLFSYDFDEDETPAREGETGEEGERGRSQSDVSLSNNFHSAYSPRMSRTCSRNGGLGSPYPGRSYATLGSPSTRYGIPVSPSAERKTDRPALGGLLTSSYRQHQESLAAERERRRLEREERLLKIEREERNRFKCGPSGLINGSRACLETLQNWLFLLCRDYVDKREEARQAREERFKNVEKLAAEEYEKERARQAPRGRTELTLSLSLQPTSASSSRCATPSSVESREYSSTDLPATQSVASEPEQEPESESDFKPATSPEPELTEPEPSTEPEEEQSAQEEVEEEQEEEVTHLEPEQETEESERTVVKQEEDSAVEKESLEVEEEEEPVVEPEPEVEAEQEQAPERENEDSAVLSEKERQNEEVNEKDNCSASSISSASSTLEREEREEKIPRDNESGQWAQCIKDVDVNEQCSKILNNKLFMLDMLYAQNKQPQEGEEAGEEAESDKDKDKEEKGVEEQDPTVASLASRISTLEASRLASEDNVKRMEVGNLDNQGSVRAFAEKFGDLVKGLVSPSESERQENQLQPEKAVPASSPLPPKKESDYIWDQLMASPRELRIKDIDFTDLVEEDDQDILDLASMGSGEPVPPPPPPPCFSALPPPPPLFGCPPPPPIPGMMPPPPPFIAPAPPMQTHIGSPQLSRGEPPLFQKKKKTIRLFWNEVRPTDWQFRNHRHCQETLWSKLEPVKLDTSKLEHLFETKSKELPVTKKTAADGKRQEIIVLDSKRSNAINIGLTVLPPPRTIKTAILNFDEYALNKEGIEKILTMIPTEEEKQKIQEAQLANPDVPLGSAEQFLLTLSSISELSARLQLWAFKMDYEVMEKEVAEPLQDLKEGMDQLERNNTLRYILSTLLAIGNFLNGSNAKGFELSYLEKVPEVKDTVHKQSLLHHACTIVVEKFPDSSDLYSEIGAVTRSAKVDFDQLQENLCQMERRCKASWDHLKVIAKHEMKPLLKQKMSEFLKDCAERIIILKIVHRRIVNRFHAFLLFLGHPFYGIREVSIHRFSKIVSEFALEYRTTRDRVLQQKQKRANHRERNKTRGKMITDSGKFGSTSGAEQDGQSQGLQYAEDAAEHENMKAVLKSSLQGGTSTASVVPGLRTRTRSRGRLGIWASGNDESPNATDDAADEIMERIVKSATQGPSQRTQPRERKRSRANRKSLRRTLKSGLTAEEAQALGLASGSEMQV